MTPQEEADRAFAELTGAPVARKTDPAADAAYADLVGAPATPTAKNAEDWRGGRLGRIARGLRDTIDGGAQTLTRGIEGASNWANQNPIAAGAFGLGGIANPGVADFLKSQRQGVEDTNAAAEQDFKQNWNPEQKGFDGYRMLGNMLMTAPVAAVKAATLPQAIWNGAKMGTALSAFNKVDNPDDNYLGQKAMQAGVGAVAGGVAPVVMAALSKAATGATNQISKLFTSPTVNQEAAQRIADAQRIGIDLTKGQATRDPAQWAFERNIRGVDGAGAPMMDRFTNQQQALIQSLNNLGAGRGEGAYKTGESAISALTAKDAAKNAVVGQAYDYARNAAGVDTVLNAPRLMDTVARQLDAALLGDKLPVTIRNAINTTGQGGADLTVGKAAQIQRAINGLYGSDNVQNKALGIVKSAIDDEIAQAGTQAGNAFQVARATAASRFNWHEAVPAAKAVASGDATPDAFLQKYILGGTVKDVQNTMASLPLKERVSVQNQVLDTIKSKALNGATDDTGTFSQAAYKQVLNSLGREKITAIVGKSKTDQLFNIGRVAETVMRQPANSTVSSSNSNVPLMNMVRPLANVQLLGTNILGPLMDAKRAYSVNQALAPNAGRMNPNMGLIPPVTQEEWMRRMMSISPMLGAGVSGGLLGSSN